MQGTLYQKMAEHVIYQNSNFLEYNNILSFAYRNEMDIVKREQCRYEK